jgi:hypothetical protein
MTLTSDNGAFYHHSCSFRQLKRGEVFNKEAGISVNIMNSTTRFKPIQCSFTNINTSPSIYPASHTQLNSNGGELK